MLTHGNTPQETETRFSPTQAVNSAVMMLQRPGPCQDPCDERPGFFGSFSEWSELGFSICEGYMIETQNLFLAGEAEGFLDMARAQDDEELEAEVLSHANVLLRGLAFRRIAGQLRVTETGEGVLGLNWPIIADLWRAMEATKGDMRLPRLAEEFRQRLQVAMRTA